MAKRFKDPLFYPSKGDYYQRSLERRSFPKVKAENERSLHTKLIGAYKFENIMAALCIAKYFGVQHDEANAAIEQYEPGNMRSQLVKKGTNTIILDAYNANPSSMQAAVENLAAMKSDGKSCHFRRYV